MKPSAASPTKRIGEAISKRRETLHGYDMYLELDELFVEPMKRGISPSGATYNSIEESVSRLP